MSFGFTNRDLRDGIENIYRVESHRLCGFTFLLMSNSYRELYNERRSTYSFGTVENGAFKAKALVRHEVNTPDEISL